ncbi:MAG TPA: DUF1573 domain-containing protein [Candidatus Wunengus sp. YC60]|uniref:DUF1573 domain-containing protein n=1 Tax=Candidatus Wunengus sp. YC60 TaxID=3367697 RepID=UPI004025E11B
MILEILNNVNEMKIYIKIIFIFFASIISINIVTASDLADKNTSIEKTIEMPKISFEEQVYDFGKIYIGESVKHEFKFKNLGKGELIINNVKSSCGCTAALVSKNILRKEEEGEVAIKFNSGHYVGKITKSVVVNSNDPENSKYKLTITGEVIEEVSVNPKRINFGIIRRGDFCTKNVEIETVPELKIDIKKVESPNPYITITKNKTIENDSIYEVTISKYDYIGKFNGIVFIYTSSSKQERIDVPFSGEIVGDMTFYPEILSFGSVKLGQDVKKTVIVNFINKDVKIEKIEAEPNNINYIISELNNISTKKIDVKLGRDITIGKITGSLKIYTNSTIQPVINIPINGEIKG